MAKNSNGNLRQVFVVVGPSNGAVLFAITPIIGAWQGSVQVMVTGF